MENLTLHPWRLAAAHRPEHDLRSCISGLLEGYLPQSVRGFLITGDLLAVATGRVSTVLVLSDERRQETHGLLQRYGCWCGDHLPDGANASVPLGGGAGSNLVQPGVATSFRQPPFSAQWVNMAVIGTPPYRKWFTSRKSLAI